MKIEQYRLIDLLSESGFWKTDTMTWCSTLGGEAGYIWKNLLGVEIVAKNNSQTTLRDFVETVANSSKQVGMKELRNSINKILDNQE